MMGLSLVAINSSLNAFCTSKFCSDVKVKALYVAEHGKIYVGTTADTDAVTVCKFIESTFTVDYAYISSDVEGKKEMYATLLAAHRDDKNISIRFAPDHRGICSVAYVISKR